MEGCFGSGKRKYSLDLIMARLSKDKENSISMAFVIMCAEKIHRVLRLSVLFFCLVVHLEMANLSLARLRNI